jgi:hypothetical protein
MKVAAQQVQAARWTLGFARTRSEGVHAASERVRWSIGRIEGLTLLTLLCGCVESTPAMVVDGGTTLDRGVAADSVEPDAGGELTETDAGDGARGEVGGSDPDGGLDLFTTPGCYLRDGGCVPRRDGARCADLHASSARAIDRCLERRIIACMENVRGTQPAAICLSRLEADGATRRYVVSSAYAYETLPHAERYMWGGDQCGDTIGWQGCPAP